MVFAPMADLPNRDLAIDVMRGMTLALMIVVNMSISETQSYAPLLHAAWHGLTLTDVVFPSFLFVVGAAMSVTMDKLAALPPGQALARIARRSALIFLCGFLLYWFPFFSIDAAGNWSLRPLSEARLLGVLQRIGLAYGLAALLILHGGQRGVLWFSAAALAFNAWVLAAFGDLTLAGNAALKIDLAVLGAPHLYKGEGIPFDPEGLLGTLPATVNVLAGWWAGRQLRQAGKSHEVTARLFMWGALAILAALSWHAVQPINKKLWTSAYTLCGIGIDLMVLATLVELIDLRGWRAGTRFFVVFGRNTLFIYLLAEVAMSVLWITHVGKSSAMEWVYAQAFQSWAGDKPGSLLFALAFTLACWSVGWVLDRRRIYIRL